ncbi:minor capsid protein [Capybara microvirus Cap3_SP_386]|nr:minor capsid protein [Capybara microvirus Cap3_SP_386]
MGLLDGIIGSTINAIGNLVNNRTQIAEAQKNRDWQTEMLQKQMDYQTEMVNLQNDYNSPSAQAQRLKDAGISSAMLGDNSLISSASPQSVGSGVSPVQPHTNNPLQVDPLTFAQVKNIDADTNKKNAEVSYTKSLTDRTNKLLAGELEIQGINLSNLIKTGHLTEEQAKLASANILKTESEISKNIAEASAKFRSIDQKDKELQLEFSRLSFQKWLAEQNLNNESKRIAIEQYNADIRMFLAESEVNLNSQKQLESASHAYELDSNALLNQSKQESEKAETEYVKVKTDIEKRFGAKYVKSQITRNRVTNITQSVGAACILARTVSSFIPQTAALQATSNGMSPEAYMTTFL